MRRRLLLYLWLLDRARRMFPVHFKNASALVRKLHPLQRDLVCFFICLHCENFLYLYYQILCGNKRLSKDVHVITVGSNAEENTLTFNGACMPLSCISFVSWFSSHFPVYTNYWCILFFLLAQDALANLIIGGILKSRGFQHCHLIHYLPPSSGALALCSSIHPLVSYIRAWKMNGNRRYL
jgi:hypothetical protein